MHPRQLPPLSIGVTCAVRLFIFFRLLLSIPRKITYLGSSCNFNLFVCLFVFALETLVTRSTNVPGIVYTRDLHIVQDGVEVTQRICKTRPTAPAPLQKRTPLTLSCQAKTLKSSLTRSTTTTSHFIFAFRLIPNSAATCLCDSFHLVSTPPSCSRSQQPPNMAPKTNGIGVQVEDTRICVVMVGLPARGKSYIAQKAQRYLKWLSIPAATFNVGNYRRNDSPHPSADFFDTNNAEGERKRRAAAAAAIADMLKWFKSGGVVGILDATNSTKERRKWVLDTVQREGVEVIFVESKCDDEELIMANIRDVKTTSPDYQGQDPEKAALDFRNRIRNYEKVYRTINADGDEDDLTYLKIMNVGKQVIINRIRDYLQSRIVYYLMNLHIRPRSVWLSRHGESMLNLEGRIGGDAGLSYRGQEYARKLPDLVRESVGSDRPLTVWTSTLKRTIATARHLPTHYNQLQWKALDELDAGVCDGMTYQEISDMYPEDFQARDEDKYNYRYRGGESYRDVVIRLEPIIMELERSEDILIISHQAVIRCIYAYFMQKTQEESPWVPVPLHTLMKLTPMAYGTKVEMFKANIKAVSTWRGKGSTAKHEDPIPEGGI